MESNETTMDWPNKKPFVLGLWGVRYQVKDVERSISFYPKHWGSIWTGKTCPLSGRCQSAISNSASVVLGRPALGLCPMAVSKSPADGTGWSCKPERDRYVHDMVCVSEPPVIVRMTLTDEDYQPLLAKAVETDFFNLPGDSHFDGKGLPACMKTA